jgi:CDP-diacylglycerol--glycerol-3-phosphate 3-phosphatidyltransferase
MFSDTVRKYSRALVEPIARLISITGISPNALTILGSLLMVGVAFVLAQGYFVLGGVLITLFALFDALDGTLARMTAQTTPFGAFLDSTLDRFSEAIIFFGLFYFYLEQNLTTELILIYVTVVGSLMVSYARARAEGIGVPVKDGLFTRFERILLLVIALLFNLVTPALWVLAVFTNFTALQRMYVVWQITAREQSQ